MSRLPDRFDLLVRKARERDCTPERQLDLLLGGLFALSEWHFINRGDQENPRPAFVELDGTVSLLLFSNPDKADDFSAERGERKPHEALGLISIRPADAIEYARQFEAHGCHHLLVNPGAFSFMVLTGEVFGFYREWIQNRHKNKIGFWIPNMTSEEEDFWQEHGL
ncbi:MAG: hypothetical protein PHD76_13515 [Methylacidiphilales bacterium]|nr:hypothetical protein [Candidatus Methylacidiphilales bacterium]